MTLLLVLTGAIVTGLIVYVIDHDTKHGYDCFQPKKWQK